MRQWCRWVKAGVALQLKPFRILGGGAKYFPLPDYIWASIIEHFQFALSIAQARAAFGTSETPRYSGIAAIEKMRDRAKRYFK